MQYDIVFVGSSFATSFFLLEYLRKAPATARVLVLERGAMRDHRWQVANRAWPLGEGPLVEEGNAAFVNLTPAKPWTTAIAFGGNSNLWWACTPRMHPDDFRTRTVYGVGVDWPITYDELEPFYAEAEEVMAVSGPADASPYPRSRPHPLPPHRLTEPDLALKRAFPTEFFAMPTARPPVATAKRTRCCASGVCGLCPVDSKFTVLNEMMHLYRDARVTLELGARALSVDVADSRATAVVYEKDGAVRRAAGDLVVLGANAIYNPHLLLRSGLTHPVLGKGLCEQVGVGVEVRLRGLSNFQGSTSLTGHGYMLYHGDRRRSRAGALIETSNIPLLRIERGRWRERLHMKVVFEDLRDDSNTVSVSPDEPDKPVVHYKAYSEYAERGIAALGADMERVLAALPVESVRIQKPSKTEGHALGTTIMGSDAEKSVVDKNLVHHRVRNLVVLGSSTFPTCAPANPTLTLAALSLWSARHLFGPS